MFDELLTSTLLGHTSKFKYVEVYMRRLFDWTSKVLNLERNTFLSTVEVGGIDLTAYSIAR